MKFVFSISLFVLSAFSVNAQISNAQNGLKVTGTAPNQTAELGGPLLFNTEIDLSGKNLIFSNSGSVGGIGIAVTSPYYLLDVGHAVGLSKNTGGKGEVFINDVRFLHAPGLGNSFMGSSSGNASVTGNFNVGAGTGVLQNITSGEFNTALGTAALLNLTTGSQNVGIGFETMKEQASGSYNIGMGTYSLYRNAGSENIALGFYTMASNTTGGSNIAVGTSALGQNTAGSGNIALGYNAGSNNTAGSGNVFIGAYAGPKTSSAASAKLYIQMDQFSSEPLIGGDFNLKRVGINRDVNTLAYNLDVNGTARINGKVLVGEETYNIPAGYSLAVKDGIVTERLKIRLRSDWPDYVFGNGYSLMPIAELEQYLLKHKHLPGIESAETVKKEGIEAGDMAVKMMQKIEELTLYVIQLKKEITALKKAD